MIRGFVDSLRVNALNEGRVVGWACDTGEPSHRLHVRVRIGDHVLGLSLADRARPDLLSHRIGDGRNGFVVPLEGRIDVSQQDLLQVEVKRQDAGDWIGLPERRAHGRRVVARHFQEEAAAELWSDSGIRNEHSEDRPVFVIGAPRSGTSAIFQSLTLVTRYRGFFEGHVLDVAAAVQEAVDEHFQTKRSHIPNPHFYHLEMINKATMQEAVQQLLCRLVSGYRTPYWADKTPTTRMVLSAPVLASIWPLARFIFMKRRGIENVMSRLRKFSEAGFEYDAADWAATMSGWRAVRGEIPGKFLELEQVELLRNPDASARAVGELLALPEDEIKALSDHLRQHRPEVTDPTGQIVSKIEDTGWTPDRIVTFRRLCDEEMRAYGYTYDDRYSRAAVGNAGSKP